MSMFSYTRDGFPVGGYRYDIEQSRLLEATSYDCSQLLQSRIEAPASFDPRGLFRSIQDPRDDMQVEDQGQQGSCFPAGTKVTMHDGSLMPIEDVRFGHQVLTHKGRSRQVVDVMQRPYTGKLYSVSVKGWGTLKMTDDHKVRVVRHRKLQWVCAKDLKVSDYMIVSRGIMPEDIDRIDISKYLDGHLTTDGDEISIFGSPQFCQRFVPLDHLTCFVLGLYAAEGCTDSNKGGEPHRATFTLHQKETDYANAVVEFGERCGCTVSIRNSKTSKAMAVRVNSSVLARFFEKVVGKYCNGKEIPHFIMSGTNEQKLSFLQGYFCGDGNFTKYEQGRKAPSGNLVACRQISAGTASIVLAQQVATLTVSLGMKPGKTFRKKAPHQRYESHCVYLYSKDVCSFFGDDYKPLTKNSRWSEEARVRTCYEGQLRKIKRITTESVTKLPVYDFTVSEDHSFVADGLVVHNCAGHAASSVVEFANWIATKRMVQLSRAFCYYAAQKEDGIQGDQGSTINGCAKVVTTYGVPREEDWPYPPRYDNRPPDSWEEQYEKAAPFKVGSHTFLKTATEVVQYIRAGLGGVQIGIDWGGEVDAQVDGHGEFRWRPSGGGGHSVAFLGWHQYGSDTFLWMLNSWGRRWGDGGWALVNHRTVANMLQNQHTVMVGYSDMGSPNHQRVDFTREPLL